MNENPHAGALTVLYGVVHRAFDFALSAMGNPLMPCSTAIRSRSPIVLA
jgi:hypothetical protein